MRWFGRRKRDDLWLGTRHALNLGAAADAARAGQMLAAAPREVWAVVRAVADWLRASETERLLGKATKPEDVAFLAGRSEGMRVLLDQIDNLLLRADRVRDEADAKRAAAVLTEERPRLNEM